jgi:hypothetical protein
MIVGNANFCISDNSVFPNYLIRLETSGIRAFPAEIYQVQYYLLTDKMKHGNHDLHGILAGFDENIFDLSKTMYYPYQ